MKRLYKALLILAIFAAVVIVLYNVYMLFNPSVKTQIAVKGTIEEVVSSEGVVIRGEEVVLKESGVIVSGVALDGERVAKGEKLADLYYGTVSPKVQAELREVSDRLSGLEILAASSGTDTGISLDTMLKGYSAEIVSAAHGGKGRDLNKIRGQIDNVVNRKIVSDSQNAAAVIAELKTKRDELESQISGEKKEVFASAAGLFFTSFDGYEGLIGTDSIDKITPSGINEIKKAKPDKNSYDAEMKIADGYAWYVAATIDEGKLPSVRKGKTVGLRFPQFGSDIYSAEIVAVSEPENGKAAIVCKGTEYNDAVYYNRFLNTDIVLSSYSGLKIFKDAVKVENDKTGVYIVQNDGTAKFKEAEVLASDEGYAVVKEDNQKENALLLYDEILITKNPVKDGDFVKYQGF